MKTNSLMLVASFILLAIGCAPMKSNKGTKKELEFSFNTEIQIDEACMEKTNFDACLFVKNPVHHRGEVFSSKIGAKTDLRQWQTAGVRITTTKSDTLENINISVKSAKNKSISPSGGQWKFPYNSDESSSFEQVSVYFWSSYATKFVEEKTGVYWAKGHQIKVFTDDAFSGYSPTANSIHLSKSTDDTALALNGALVAYFVGLANVHFSNDGQIQNLASDKDHSSCNPNGGLPKKNFCCKTENGCSKAIASGAAEYFSAMTFPQKPGLGESWVNRLDGLKICSLSRNPEENKTTTVSTAFSSCASHSMNGHPLALGTVYASIWWEVRSKAKGQSPTGETEIDRLFQQHLARIDGADNFLTAYQKIIATDKDLFGSKHVSLFREEFRKRGLSVE